SLLHRVLDIRIAHPGSRKRSTRHRAHRAADVFQQASVNSLVARHGGLHHPGPWIVWRAFSRQSAHTAFVPFCPSLQVHEHLLSWNDAAIPCNTPPFDREDMGAIISPEASRGKGPSA